MDFETGRAVLLVERQRGKLGVKGSQEKKMEDVSHRKTMPLAAGKKVCPIHVSRDSICHFCPAFDIWTRREHERLT